MAVPAPQPSAQPCTSCPLNRNPSASPATRAVSSHHRLSPPQPPPGLCQTPHPPHSMSWGPACSTLETPANTCSPPSTPQLPIPRAVAVQGTLGGRQDTWGATVRECRNTETSRDQPCSTPKGWEQGITAQLWSVVLHKRKQSREVFQPSECLVLSNLEKSLRSSSPRDRGRTPALKQGVIISPRALKSFCSLDVQSRDRRTPSEMPRWQPELCASMATALLCFHPALLLFLLCSGPQEEL